MNKLEEEIRSDWFKDHRATIEVQGDQTIIKWKKEGTNIFAVYYIIRHNHLFVYGDIGDAIYQWSSKIDLEFLAHLNLDYFASKCQASESGRGYEEWNDEECFERVKSWLSDIKAEVIYEEEWEEGGEREEVTFESWVEAYLWDNGGTSIGEIREACDSKEQWWNWLETYGHELFDSDYVELGHVGFTPSNRCFGHLIGLKMVAEQIKKGSENDKAANIQ